MIIEAGYDLWDLILPRLEAEARDDRGLWMITMNDDLRLNSVRAIADRTDGVMVDHVADVLAGIASDFDAVRYFALAHRVAHAADDIAERVYEGDKALLESMDIDRKTFLGRLVLSDDHMYSRAPRYEFRDYPLSNHLPRAGVVQGPHPIDCECFPCTQFNELIAEARARAAAPEGEDSTDDPWDDG